MHRSRLSALAIFAGAAACSTRGDSDTKILSQDQALAATLDGREQVPEAPLPGACGAIASRAQPAAANRTRAEALARQGYKAEVLGDTRDAQALLLRATELDGTDKVAAYHLGRTSEALGDRARAVSAYCRYLTLTPTTVESAEARQRVAMLSPAETRLSAGSVTNTPPATRQLSATLARPVSRQNATVRGRVVLAGNATRSTRVASSERRRRSRSAASIGNDDSAQVGDATATMSREGDGRAEPTTVDGDVVATSRRTSAADRSATASRTAGGLGRAQGAGIGAVTGALIGAAAGRSVKSAMIGAAAGGLFGAVVGGRVD